MCKDSEKRTLFDLTTAVPNKAFKKWIEDPSDLKRERKEVPHTILHAWRAHTLGHAPQSLFEPLSPGISTDVGYLEFKKSSTAPIKSVESPAVQDDVKSPFAHEQIPDTISPSEQRSREQTPIAPGTPLTHLNALRSHEAPTVADSDTSLESIERWPPSSYSLNLETEFHQEANSFEGESLEKDTCSAKTRIAGRWYLCRKFLEQKRQKKEQVLNLSQLLAGKTKKESAGLFYEILALKTRDCIEVQQENAYDDIILRETSKLKQHFGN